VISAGRELRLSLDSSLQSISNHNFYATFEYNFFVCIHPLVVFVRDSFILISKLRKFSIHITKNHDAISCRLRDQNLSFRKLIDSHVDFVDPEVTVSSVIGRLRRFYLRRVKRTGLTSECSNENSPVKSCRKEMTAV